MASADPTFALVVIGMSAQIGRLLLLRLCIFFQLAYEFDLEEFAAYICCYIDS